MLAQPTVCSSLYHVILFRAFYCFPDPLSAKDLGLPYQQHRAPEIQRVVAVNISICVQIVGLLKPGQRFHFSQQLLSCENYDRHQELPSCLPFGQVITYTYLYTCSLSRYFFLSQPSATKTLRFAQCWVIRQCVQSVCPHLYIRSQTHTCTYGPRHTCTYGPRHAGSVRRHSGICTDIADFSTGVYLARRYFAFPPVRMREEEEGGGGGNSSKQQ